MSDFETIEQNIKAVEKALEQLKYGGEIKIQSVDVSKKKYLTQKGEVMNEAHVTLWVNGKFENELILKALFDVMLDEFKSNEDFQKKVKEELLEKVLRLRKDLVKQIHNIDEVVSKAGGDHDE